MPQRQPEPERRKPSHTSSVGEPAEERLEWSPIETDWKSQTDHESERPSTAPHEHGARADVRAEERRRERQTAAFSGCIHGGATAFMSQLLADGGDDELLIQGAGIWIASDHRDDPLRGVRSKPVVYCHPSLVAGVEGRPILASDYPQLIRYLGFVTGGELPPEELLAIGTEAAVEDWTPGSAINGSQSGTLGAPCSFNGAAAILTAGHVTDGQPTVTFGSSPANVRLESHAGTNPIPLAIGPDIAVIDLPPGQRGGAPLAVRTTRMGPSKPLRLLGGTRTGNVLAIATFLRVQTRSGCWGDVYQLDVSIGGPGDSGAAVVDSTGSLAGHYLGRLGKMAVVQDVTYQVGELAKSGVTIP